MHLKQPQIIQKKKKIKKKTTKKNKIIQKVKETGDSRYVNQKEIDKACFQQDMAYRDFKDLPRHTASDKVLHDIRKFKKCKPYSTFKGYLRYKTITSQNVSSEAQVKNFFIS